LVSNRYEYKLIDGNIVNINIETKFCSCRFFNDKAICKHLVSACTNDDVELYDLIPKSNKFKFLRRRLMRSLDESIEVNNEVVKVTKALIVVKNALTIDDPVVEVIANK
jgi:hypothetical protein